MGFHNSFKPGKQRIFVVLFNLNMGIILAMISKLSFLKTTFIFLALICFSGLTAYPLIPKAHALFWEDDTDSNDPKEVIRRPDHFGLFDWVDDIGKTEKEKHYRDMDNPDSGPGVNSGARTLEVVTSGIVGFTAGLFIANRVTTDQTQMTTNLFIGGSIGLGVGIVVGALIMPRDYEVDQHVRIEYLKERQAWLQDPVRLDLQKAFRPTDFAFSLSF